MIRAVRLAATLEFEVEPGDGRRRSAGTPSWPRHLSGERVCAELLKLLAAPRPSVGLRLMGGPGLLAVVAPDLARQRGIAQNKIDGEDLWDHTLRTVDAAPDRPVVRLAALLHDIGKPRHARRRPLPRPRDASGAVMARDFLARLHAPRAPSRSEWPISCATTCSRTSRPGADAAIRRFIRKVGPGSVDDLLALRAADNEGSGLPADAGHLAELASRIRAELAAHVVLGRGQLAVDGNDLMAELGLAPGSAAGPAARRADGASRRRAGAQRSGVLLEMARQSISGGQSLDNPSASTANPRHATPSRGRLMFELLLQADKALAEGLLDQAERTYWQLIELDPTNAIAVAGLARVSLGAR